MKKNVTISMDIETYEHLSSSPMGISGTISCALRDYQDMKATIERLQAVVQHLTSMLHTEQEGGEKVKDGTDRTRNKDTQTRL